MSLPGPALAANWDAAADFATSPPANPSGVWSYGYDPAALPDYQVQIFDSVESGLAINWHDSSYQSLGTPTVGKNVSAGTINGIAPGQFYLHPGPVANGDHAVLRFTAPFATNFKVEGRFFAGDTSETDAWVVKNGDFLSPYAVLGTTSGSPSFSFTGIGLVMGDTLDFVVGNHGSFVFDSTPLDLQISTVPELTAGAMWLCGLACVGALALRRRRGASASLDVPS